MAIWGGIALQPDGRRVFQIFVDADDLRAFLDSPDRGDYIAYDDDDNELAVGPGDGFADEVWLCPVFPDPT